MARTVAVIWEPCQCVWHEHARVNLQHNHFTSDNLDKINLYTYPGTYQTLTSSGKHLINARRRLYTRVRETVKYGHDHSVSLLRLDSAHVMPPMATSASPRPGKFQTPSNFGASINRILSPCLEAKSFMMST